MAKLCDNTDFQTVLAMVKVLLLHTAKVFQQLSPIGDNLTQNVEKTQLYRQFFDSLPSDFDRQAMIAAANKLNIPVKTAERHIKQWCENGRLNHTAHGKYSKPGTAYNSNGVC